MDWRGRYWRVRVSHSTTDFMSLPLGLTRMAGKGPSGENKEYLYNLEKALLGLSRESGDAHVSDLVGRCRALEREEGREK
jgi:hypothetical protein